MAKKINPYFDYFISMANYSCEAAEYLKVSLQEFTPESLSGRRATMHKIEHAADEVKHTLIRRLAKEFMTPIDREDIIQMSSELDNVTDKIEDVLIRMYMYNIRQMRPEAVAFADVIVRCCQSLKKAMNEFNNFHKSTTLKQAIIDVNTMEEEGDAIYIDAMRKLYEGGSDPITIHAWSELFDCLEDCCDACEHVADIMEIIVLKNT